MCIVFVPDYSEANPYQANLATELDADVVMGGEDGRLPVIQALWSRDVTVVHYHWMDQYFRASSFRWQLLTFGVFALQLLIIRLSGIPVVWTVHNVISHDARYPRVERRFKRWFLRSGTCDRAVVHCEGMVETVVDTFDLPESARDRIDVIPHGHYCENYEDDVSKTTARAELGLDDEATVFLFFGLIRRYKGVTDLVKAFHAAALPDSHLLIAGQPQSTALKRELEHAATASDRVHADLTFIASEEVQYYMNAADAVVLPFRETTTSGTTILAMSFGRAVVVPRLGCLSELVDEDGAIRYAPTQYDGLIEALRTVPTRDVEAMGSHNRTQVQQYDWERIAEMTTRTYLRTGADADYQMQTAVAQEHEQDLVEAN